MEDVVKNDVLGEFIRDRIEENKELFTENELTTINQMYILIKKIYILGMLDSQSVK